MVPRILTDAGESGGLEFLEGGRVQYETKTRGTWAATSATIDFLRHSRALAAELLRSSKPAAINPI